MARKFLVADLLCGAGGSSTGAQRAMNELGLDMELVCVNHWPVAIDTHQRNHREARHYVQDIATVRPHILVPEGYLDLLMASPTCTHHSVARGGKPTSDQQRSDPWHIITWLTELRVKRLIIENVWEFISWGPVNPKTGKPIASRRGEYFHAWIETLKRLGFDPEWRKLNAADYGDATTRQRFMLMARSDGRRVHWPMPTHKKRDDNNVDLFATSQPWRPAREIIDWKIKGRSIFNRKKALAPKTLARIYAGATKFNWPEPYLVILRNHMSAQGMDQPLPTIAAGGMHIGIAEPIIMNGRKGNKAEGVSEGLVPTLDTKGGVWLAEPVKHHPLCSVHTGKQGHWCDYDCAREYPQGVVEHFVLSQASGGSPRAVSEPIPTQTTGGNGAAHALISPYYGSGSGETCNSVDDALPTITTLARFGMVVPVTNSNGGAVARNIDVDPIATMTTAKGGEFAMVETAPEYDILFRMLEPHELAAAMGFNTDDEIYEFAGTKTQMIKQIGNAVSVRKMKACVGAIMADAAPKSKVSAPLDYLEAAE